MPTVSAYFSDSEIDGVKQAIAQTDETPAEYAAKAVRERMRREGHVPGNPAFDVRAEALSTAEIVGHDTVVRSLRRLRSKKAGNRAA